MAAVGFRGGHVLDLSGEAGECCDKLMETEVDEDGAICRDPVASPISPGLKPGGALPH